VYELTVKGRFAAAHQLRKYKGKCENLHGHNWKIEVTLRTAVLDDIGLGVDFKEIKAIMEEVLKELDHQCLNDLPAFQTENPSSERIARWIFEQMARRMENDQLKVARVTAWESDDACATYFLPES
jgi:6-pyruvoyltetrahydropterin/6-carboxytetrahydropterin synthase